MVSWLEHKPNRDAIYGTDKATRVGTQYKNQTAGLQALANALKTNSRGRLSLSSKNVGGRLQTYRSKLKKAIQKENSTGFGLTENDCQAGVFTVAQKLDKICPFFERMKSLFGEDPALCPLTSFDSMTKPNETEPFSGEDDKLNDKYIPRSDSSSPEVGASTPVVFDHPAISQIPCDLSSPFPTPIIPLEHFEFDDLASIWGDNFASILGDTNVEISPTVVTKQSRGIGIPTPSLTVTINASRSTDCRKKPPTLISKSSQSRNHMAQFFQEVLSPKKSAFIKCETPQLDFEKQKWESEQSCSNFETIQLDFERYKFEAKLQERTARYETVQEQRATEKASKFASKLNKRKSSIVMAALDKGKSAEEIKVLLSLLEN